MTTSEDESASGDDFSSHGAKFDRKNKLWSYSGPSLALEVLTLESVIDNYAPDKRIGATLLFV